MSLARFRSYQLAVSFYREVSRLRVPAHLRDQLLRASSSVVLNLAEGSAKGSHADRVRFYRIAFGSQRECQAILALLAHSPEQALKLGNELGGHLFGLVNSLRS